MFCTFEPSDRAFDSSDLISIINDSRSLVVKMISEPLNVRSDDSKVHNTVLCTAKQRKGGFFWLMSVC